MKYTCICLFEQACYITLHFIAGNNSTLLAELYEVFHDFFSYEVTYEYPAGPNHYLILTHNRFHASGGFIDTE